MSNLMSSGRLCMSASPQASLKHCLEGFEFATHLAQSPSFLPKAGDARSPTCMTSLRLGVSSALVLDLTEAPAHRGGHLGSQP